jgi:transcriptional regulator with XRE-family HTH domain
MTTEERDPIGSRLKAARETAGYTGTGLAEALGWPSGTGKYKISKIERGRQIPTAEDITAWAQATGMNDRLRDQLISKAAEAEATRDTYSKRAAHGQEPIQDDYTKRAARTKRFTFFEMTFIPRYLQTPDYMRATLQEHHDKHGTVDDVAAAVRKRQESVRFLTDPDKQFTFLIDEPVLRRRRFPASIMRAQLFHLSSAIGLDNVTLAIYPSLSRQVNSNTESSFEIFDDEACIETAVTDEEHLADKVEVLETLFARYWQDAVTGDDARQLILDAINHLPA